MSALNFNRNILIVLSSTSYWSVNGVWVIGSNNPVRVMVIQRGKYSHWWASGYRARNAAEDITRRFLELHKEYKNKRFTLAR